MIEISISIILSIGIANAIITFACFIFVHRSLSDVRVLFLIKLESLLVRGFSRKVNQNTVLIYFLFLAVITLFMWVEFVGNHQRGDLNSITSCDNRMRPWHVSFCVIGMLFMCLMMRYVVLS